MLKYAFTSILFLLSYTCSFASQVSAKDAYKAMLRLQTYDKNGTKMTLTTAFYIDNQGTVVAAYSALKDAYRAEVIDVKGKRYELYRILGANSSTDLAKFSIKGATKTDYFNIATTATEKGEKLLLMRYTTEKKRTPLEVTINNDEPFKSYKYFYTNALNDSTNFACPLVDNEGNIRAILQKNVDKKATKACAIDARFINELSINATSAFNADFTSLHFPKALPQNAKDALTFLYILPTNDSTACLTAYADYIEAYPTLPEGYLQRATFYAAKNQLYQADKDFLQAINKAQTCKDTSSVKEDAIHNTISRIVYNKVMEQGKDSALQANWNLLRAEKEAEKAYSLHPSTLYLIQKGNCQYAQRKYKEAYSTFSKACEDKTFTTSETYFSAARSLELSKGDSLQVIALLDSCIAQIPSQNKARYAQFYFERSQRLIKAKQYRKAVADYNEYEQLIGPRNLNDQFYYLRSKAEEKAHMYQQALDDLHTAIATSKQPILYQIDEAALLLNIGEYQRAITAAQDILKTLPENPDCYKILGIAHGELKHKTQALQYLKKAQELGDDSVETLLEKYK